MMARTNRSSGSVCRTLAASLVAAWTITAIHSSEAAVPDSLKIAVFDFELYDTSAGSGIIGQDATDTEYLKKSTEEVRHMLSASGRYNVVDTSGVAGQVSAAGGVQRCNGCDRPLAKRLGADQSVIGVITRLSRVEYTLQILVSDTRTGAVVSNNFVGPVMGANHGWPHGAKLLMKRILSAQRAE